MLWRLTVRRQRSGAHGIRLSRSSPKLSNSRTATTAISAIIGTPGAATHCGIGFTGSRDSAPGVRPREDKPLSRFTAERGTSGKCDPVGPNCSGQRVADLLPER